MSDDSLPITIGAAVPRVVEAIQAGAWAITPEALETMAAIAERRNDISVEALEKITARRANGSYGLSIRDGVGIMAIEGPLFRYANLFTMISGGTSYQLLALDLERAKNDPSIRSLILAMDTPGGEVNSCAEFAEAVYEFGKVKPVEAYVGGQACSAGYWIACATNNITLGETAYVGSIGTRVGIRDTSERDAKSGVRHVEFISSRAPNKRLDYSSDEGRAKIQRHADSLEAVFIGAVARYRGVSEDTVANEFGGGGTEVGREAVALGMADAIGSFEGVFARMAAAGAVAFSNRRKSTMSTTTPQADAKFTQADIDAARAAGAEAQRKEAEEASAKEAKKTDASASATAATAATERVKTILNCEEAKDRPELAKHLAFDTQMSAEDASKMLARAGKETAEGGSSAAAAPNRAKDSANGLAMPDAQVNGGGDGAKAGDKNPPVPSAASIYKKRAEAMSGK